MNYAHVHIVLNHLPVLGTLAGLAMLLVSMFRKSAGLERASLAVLAVMAFLALPTYVTGGIATRMLQGQETPPPPGYIEVHQDAAILALTMLTIMGTLAWIALWQYRRNGRSGPGLVRAVSVTAVLTSAFILQTASLGGKISHPEVRAADAAVPEQGQGLQKVVTDLMALNGWTWPAAESLHFVGMVMVFGVVLAITLRMLGLMKGVSFEALHKLLPIAILGFVMNVATGMLFFISSPGLYVTNPGFAMKIYLILFAGLSVVYYTAMDAPWKIGADTSPPMGARLVALGTLGLVLGIMWYGRLLPWYF
jgi:hypothetical protein